MRSAGRLPGLGLALAGLLSAGSGAVAADGPDPHYAQMIAAAGVMQAAGRILYAEKATLGLLPPPATDPNHTGMIGLEYTTMTTTPGEVADKRTATSPDLAAALVKLLAGFNLPVGAPVVTVLSGSYVGGDVAMLAALEQLGAGEAHPHRHRPARRSSAPTIRSTTSSIC